MTQKGHSPACGGGCSCLLRPESVINLSLFDENETVGQFNCAV